MISFLGSLPTVDYADSWTWRCLRHFSVLMIQNSGDWTVLKMKGVKNKHPGCVDSWTRRCAKPFWAAATSCWTVRCKAGWKHWSIVSSRQGSCQTQHPLRRYLTVSCSSQPQSYISCCFNTFMYRFALSLCWVLFYIFYYNNNNIHLHSALSRRSS